MKISIAIVFVAILFQTKICLSQQKAYTPKIQQQMMTFTPDPILIF
jgi:hypothetical protein